MADSLQQMTECIARTHFIERAGNEVKRLLFGDESDPVRKCRVLVVEDCPDVQACFALLFRQPSLSHVSASYADSVNQALAMMATDCYDLLILDYQLDDGTAEDMVKLMETYGYELPFIGVSGYNDTELKMRGMGAVAFISKSDLTPDALARAIRAALSGFWSRKSATLQQL